MTSEAFNLDCMIGMKQYPDKFFDLAVVDPPYGIEWKGTGFKKKNIQERNLTKLNGWDVEPTIEYFIEVRRVSKNFIVWGGNYFADKLGKSTHIIVWDKETGENPFADGEIAFTSFKSNTLRIIKHQWCGAFKDSERGEQSIHPTQKPIAVYSWIYSKYLKEGGKVIDTHLGSGSNRIAADKAGNIDFTGYELDKDYFEAQEKRWKNYKMQLTMF